MAKRTPKCHTVPARGRVQLSAGEMVRVTRELQEMTQAELAAASGIAQGTISSIEVGRVSLGVERAERLARALKARRCCSGRTGERRRRAASVEHRQQTPGPLSFPLGVRLSGAPIIARLSQSRWSYGLIWKRPCTFVAHRSSR